MLLPFRLPLLDKGRSERVTAFRPAFVGLREDPHPKIMPTLTNVDLPELAGRSHSLSCLAVRIHMLRWQLFHLLLVGDLDKNTIQQLLQTLGKTRGIINGGLESSKVDQGLHACHFGRATLEIRENNKVWGSIFRATPPSKHQRVMCHGVPELSEFAGGRPSIQHFAPSLVGARYRGKETFYSRDSTRESSFLHRIRVTAQPVNPCIREKLDGAKIEHELADCDEPGLR